MRIAKKGSRNTFSGLRTGFSGLRIAFLGLRVVFLGMHTGVLDKRTANFFWRKRGNQILKAADRQKSC